MRGDYLLRDSDVSELTQVLSYNEDLKNEVARLRALIAEVEWAYSYSCPWCEAGMPTATSRGSSAKHQQDCAAFTPEGEVR